MCRIRYAQTIMSEDPKASICLFFNIKNNSLIKNKIIILLFISAHFNATFHHQFFNEQGKPSPSVVSIWVVKYVVLFAGRKSIQNYAHTSW